MLRILALAIGCLLIASATSAQTAPPAPKDPMTPADPYLWLEDVSGARAMDWVKAENVKTLGVLEKDSRFAGLLADALTIAEAKDRIPAPEFLAGQVYNFWQDSDHVRGVWRKTSLDDYARPEPAWTTALDLDALSKAEKANWVWKGSDCEWRAERRCMINLSDGGEDAITLREFDLETGGFVDGGFTLPHGKQTSAWADPDTLLVSREWASGELTTSGYPFVVKQIKRGQPLSAAVEVFRGDAKDGGYGVSPQALHDGEDHQALLINRPLSTFEAENYLVTLAGVKKLALPLKVQIDDMVAGRILVTLNENWSIDGASFPQGALVSIDLAEATADPDHLKPRLVYAPGPRESIEAVSATKSNLFVVVYQNVKGRAFVYTPVADGGWSHRQLDLPDNASISLVGADPHSERAFLSVTSFLTPTTLWLADAADGHLVQVKALSPKFDASKDVVEQYEATSKDGTKIPYFLVHPRTMTLDGSTPTVLYAYGGFQVSMTPSYGAIQGKLWLERGGAYVLANIRGGGEFGPAWHDAGLKTHRQLIYDDFAAVAEDLIARKVTSPRRLGIQGGSNGGLLRGVEFTQHPELWNAVDIQVPLLDMLRFEQIAAGTSWVGEYGSVSNPDERAFLASISPYNNLKPDVTYPEPFIWTTTKDDRVGPQHARKFAAKLAGMGKPYMFYEVIEGGHGAGANLRERAHTSALEITYFIRKLMD